MFSLCIKGHSIPDEWKIRNISNFPQFDNYRGITVTSTMSRLYERVIRDLIEEEYKTIKAKEQSVFRAGRSRFLPTTNNGKRQ